MRRKRSLYFLMASLLSFSFFYSAISSAQPAIEYEPFISSGLSSPMEVVSAPGDISGRLFIVEKGGIVKIWKEAAILPEPFLDISADITSDGERGLLSMAFHPGYASNGYFFVYYTGSTGAITVARYKVSSNPDMADPEPDPATPLITISKSFPNHNGGHLQFRTEEGIPYLYFGTGDGGGSNDPGNNAQNPSSLLGKIIRINVDETHPVTPEIWAIGLRNPFRWSFDRVTGDMWIGDVGQNAKEEINFREAGSSGANYGWRCYEGTIQNMDINPLCDPPGKVAPVFEYNNPGEGSSVIGGYVYRGDEFAALQGYYFTADYYTGTVWILQRDGNGNVNMVNTQPDLKGGISSISETEDGTLYATALTENAVYKIIPLASTPLTLLNFSGLAADGYNELKWVTAMEQRIEKFIIEYSSNGRDFNAAGSVKATNNANGAAYVYGHYGITGSKLFYRLHIIEADGVHHYSPVIALSNDDHTGIKIYPTIITNGLLHIVSGKKIESIQCFASNGKQVLTRQLKGVNGYFSVALNGLPKGIYIVRLSSRDFHKNQKIIVQ